jgi:spore germination protein GerM
VDFSQAGYYAFMLEDVLYFIAAMGEQPTSGYEIAFTEYRDNEDQTWDMFLETTTPKPDEVVLQVITYPAAFTRFYPDGPVEQVRFSVDGQESVNIAVTRLVAPEEETEVTLFFGTEDAYLSMEPRPVPISYQTDSPEKKAETLVYELLKGSMSQFGTVRVLPSSTQLTGVIYDPKAKRLEVSLSGQFTELGGSAAELLAVYSIVNTLTQIEGVETVTLVLEDGELQHMDNLEELTYNAELVVNNGSTN